MQINTRKESYSELAKNAPGALKRGVTRGLQIRAVLAPGNDRFHSSVGLGNIKGGLRKELGEAAQTSAALTREGN